MDKSYAALRPPPLGRIFRVGLSAFTQTLADPTLSKAESVKTAFRCEDFCRSGVNGPGNEFDLVFKTFQLPLLDHMNNNQRLSK
ncbi:hypothetical protein F5887DRAFT_1069452 [Amanita rubescens]|nr:hypothetical protein F5887DRAFT_1069452 [Amanita rubescens]